MIILRQKNYAMTAGGNSYTMSEVKKMQTQMGAGTSASAARDALVKQLDTNSANQSAIRTQTRNLNKQNHDQFVSMGKTGNKTGIEALKSKNATTGAFNAGQGSVSGLSGLKQWGQNTYNSLSKNQQTGLKIAGGAAAIGATALAIRGLRNRKKKDED